MSRSANPIGRLVAALAVSWLLGACATVPSNAGSNPADPFERVNRQVYAFNDGFDRAITKPIAQGYQAVVPHGVRTCIGNVFANVGEVGNFVNAVLQASPRDAATDVGRFGVNSTLGLLGCFDVATRMGMERSKQDFGITLGKWGVGSGPYVVLPFLGPSTVRDAFGEIPDYYTDPVNYIKPAHRHYYVYAVRFVDRRAQLLDASSLVDQAALDPYSFLRDSYLQLRRNRVYDGNPPPPPEEDDPDAPAPSAAPPPAAPAAAPTAPPTAPATAPAP